MKPKTKTPKAKREFYEAAWRRSDLTDFDAAWKRLSPASREVFLKRVEVPYAADAYYRTPIPKSVLTPDVLRELVDAKLIEEFSSSYYQTAKGTPTYAMTGAARPFAIRMRSAFAFSRPSEDEGNRIHELVRTMIGHNGETALSPVLRRGGMTEVPAYGIVSRLIVRSKDWPDWVLKVLDDELAGRIVEELERRTGPIPPDELAAAVAPGRPEEFRTALGRLIGHLAVFESLDPATFELRVGLLPDVARRRRSLKDKRPTKSSGTFAFEVVESPAEYAPRTGLVVADLAEVLLELSTQPVRVKQTGGYFVADLERIGKRLPEWPEWLAEAVDLDVDDRVESALDSAELLDLVTRRREEKRDLIVPSAEAARWLTLDHEARIDTLLDYPRKPGKRDIEDVAATLGATVSVVERKPNAPAPRADRYLADRAFLKCDFAKLEESVLSAFRRMPLGKYVRLDDVVEGLSAIGRNPLTLGRPLDKVWILIGGMVMPPLADPVETMTSDLLRKLVLLHLVPLEAMLAARDSAGAFCVARTPRLDRYFGKASTESMAEADGGPTRVLIQPDYSVVAIGLDPTPVFDLVPFCERKPGAASPGAVTLKITRESVLRAATAGMPADQMIERLRKHASAAVPENVVRQIKDWAGWIRRVSARPMIVVDCGASDAADRVVAAIGSGSVRLGPDHVGLTTKSITPEQRKKLAAQGITVVDPASGAPKAARRKSTVKSVAMVDFDDLDFD